MAKVVTMGEIMLRLSPPGNRRIVQADTFEVQYGGGEANVAVSLALLGLESEFLTKLPDNSLGDAALCQLRRFGVHTQHIVRGGQRLGIYFLEPGVSMRPSRVVYDRKGSSFSEAEPEEFDFDAIFHGADWFHLTGITPALSERAALLSKRALEAAKRHGVFVSLDVNYRKMLWSKARAREVMAELLPSVDLCIGGRSHMSVMLGLEKPQRPEGGNLDVAEYKHIFEEMRARFGIKKLVSSLRESPSASDNSYSTLLYDDGNMHQSRRYDIRIVDRIGGGDAFAAGLIYGMCCGMEFFEAGEFGVAASALKHTIPGDMNVSSKEEIFELLGSDGSGRVQR